MDEREIMNDINVRIQGIHLIDGFLGSGISVGQKIYFPIYFFGCDYQLNQKPEHVISRPFSGITKHLGLNRYQWLGTVLSIHCNDYYGSLNMIVEVGDYRWIWTMGGSRLNKPGVLVPQVGRSYAFEGELFLDGRRFMTRHNRTGNYYQLSGHKSFAYSAMQLYDVNKIQRYEDIGCMKTGSQGKEMRAGDFILVTDDEPETYSERGDWCVHDYILTLKFLNQNGLDEYNRLAHEAPEEMRNYIP